MLLKQEQVMNPLDGAQCNQIMRCQKVLKLLGLLLLRIPAQALFILPTFFSDMTKQTGTPLLSGLAEIEYYKDDNY